MWCMHAWSHFKPLRHRLRPDPNGTDHPSLLASIGHRWVSSCPPKLAVPILTATKTCQAHPRHGPLVLAGATHACMSMHMHERRRPTQREEQGNELRKEGLTYNIHTIPVAITTTMHHRHHHPRPHPHPPPHCRPLSLSCIAAPPSPSSESSCTVIVINIMHSQITIMHHRCHRHRR